MRLDFIQGYLIDSLSRTEFCGSHSGSGVFTELKGSHYIYWQPGERFNLHTDCGGF